jgi:hypothetical protein
MRKIFEIAILSVFFVLNASFQAVGADYKLPDTGVQDCYDNTKKITCPNPGQAFYGQDAQYHRNQLEYKDNKDGTVTDLNTGLMWQQADDGAMHTWQESIDYCEALVLPSGVYSDWRLPERGELMSLLDFGRFDPAIDTKYFPGCRTSPCYWSINAYAEDPDYAWVVRFWDGYIAKWDKNVSDWTRCVRGGF